MTTTALTIPQPQPIIQGLSLQEKLAWSAAGVVVLSGAVYFGYKWVASMRTDREEGKSLDDGSAAAYAKEIKMAFDNDGWWGTDTTKLREVMRRIPSKKVFDDTVASYTILFGTNMLRDMSEELSSSEYSEMMQIKAGKPDKSGAKVPINPQSTARRLKAAFDKTYGFIPGTDEEAIRAAFIEIPSQTAFIQVGVAYYKEYGKHLTGDLKSELSESDYFNMMKLITAKPKT